MKKIISILSALILTAALTVVSFAGNLGDVNGDGEINSYDALNVLRYSVGIESPGFILANADVNRDSKINSADALFILRVSVGLETIENDECIDSYGHSFGNWKTIVEPTKTTDGKMQRVCQKCNKMETKAVSKLSSTVSDYQQEVLRLVNVERAKEGLSPLEYYFPGQAAADIRAKEIDTKFDHERPDGTMCFTALNEQGITYYHAGENIAYGFSTPQEVVNAWMNSPGHRANILSGDFNYIIVGVYKTGWVQLFIGID